MKLIYAVDWSDVPDNFTGIVEWDNGTKYWILDGRVHREDNPAVEGITGIKKWSTSSRKWTSY